MHFVVIGGGNIGCLYGANLARIGEQVTVVDVWAEHVDTIRSTGLRMAGLHGEFTADVSATTDPADVASADCALICVNSYSTREAAEAAKRVLKQDGYALTLQNGMGHLEVLAEVLGAGNVVGGLTFHSGDLAEPGHVEHTNHGPTYLGELDRSTSGRVADLNRLLADACMDPVIEPDILSTIWGKFVHNCGINAICAATDLRPGHIKEVPEVDAFQTQIIEEAMALLAAKGVVIGEKDPVTAIKEYCATHFHRVSMAQHLDRGRRTEIDSLNGYVAAESDKLGLTAPANRALTQLVKGIEHRPSTEV